MHISTLSTLKKITCLVFVIRTMATSTSEPQGCAPGSYACDFARYPLGIVCTLTIYRFGGVDLLCLSRRSVMVVATGATPRIATLATSARSSVEPHIVLHKVSAILFSQTLYIM